MEELVTVSKRDLQVLLGFSSLAALAINQRWSLEKTALSGALLGIPSPKEAVEAGHRLADSMGVKNPTESEKASMDAFVTAIGGLA